MNNFEEIDKARNLLGLGERATLKELEHAYRQMASCYHPDNTETCDQYDETIKQLNWAFELLLDYFENYSYSFSKEDVIKTYPREEYFNKLFQDWFGGVR